MNQPYPILEFDPTRTAIIEPSKRIKLMDVPEHCVICFFKEIVTKVCKEHETKTILRREWEDGEHLVHELDYKGKRISIFPSRRRCANSDSRARGSHRAGLKQIHRMRWLRRARQGDRRWAHHRAAFSRAG